MPTYGMDGDIKQVWSMAKSEDTLRREQQRKERQAAELRSNLAKRKEQKRQQSAAARADQPPSPGQALARASRKGDL